MSDTDLPLRRRCELLEDGVTDRAVGAKVRAGSLVRVRPGVYVDGSAWRGARPEERVIARARALSLVSHTPPVASHETAAALHGLPVFRPDPARVHVIVPTARPGAATGVVRHRGELDPSEVVEIDGVVCTSLERTIADMARTASTEQSVVAGDAALRAICGVGPGQYARDLAADFTERVRTIAHRSAHGVARADRRLAFIDGRAQLPGESISRIRLHQAGFRRLDLQVPVAGPPGRGYFFVDFWLRDAHAFGEFDGSIKYTDGRYTDDRSSFEVFDREKAREDWIRGSQQAPLVRWGWSHIRTAETLAARLAAFGVVAP
ncbi:hypothetical protein GCM10022200_13300 [Microbacterium awajiense]|uniref:Transcriptional regulator, AbiEi antitoxin, Type IV TA system n=1 Tax=Microbacterium awajiense TaxID=415214 RepID=A0ABP7AGI4_9MICO